METSSEAGKGRTQRPYNRSKWEKNKFWESSELEKKRRNK